MLVRGVLYESGSDRLKVACVRVCPCSRRGDRASGYDRCRSRDRRGAYRPSRSRSRERDRLRGRGYDRPARDRDRDRAARPAYRYAAPRELEPGEEPCNEYTI